MFKKMLPWLIIMLVAISLIVLTSFILLNFVKNQDDDPTKKAQQSVQNIEHKQLSAKEINELTLHVNDIVTNLATKDAVKVSFAFQLSDKKTYEEFTLLEFRVRGIINQTLADLSPDQIRGSQGQDLLTTMLMNKINAILSIGKITQIDITTFILP